MRFSVQPWRSTRACAHRTHVHKHTPCRSTHLHSAHTHTMQEHACVHMHTRTHTLHTHAHMHTQLHTCTHTMKVHTCTYIHICTHTQHAGARTHMHTSTHRHTCTHVHTHGMTLTVMCPCIPHPMLLRAKLLEPKSRTFLSTHSRAEGLRSHARLSAEFFWPALFGTVSGDDNTRVRPQVDGTAGREPPPLGSISVDNAVTRAPVTATVTLPSQPWRGGGRAGGWVCGSTVLVKCHRPAGQRRLPASCGLSRDSYILHPPH